MRRDGINYFIVGVFVLAVVTALLALLYRLTGGTGPSDSYHAFYDNVAGIKYGTVTYYKGFQVGQVERIEPQSQAEGPGTRYRVQFSVKQDWPIPRGSVAAIVLPGPLAPAVVDIREGEGPDLLPPDSELKGAEPVNMFAALNDVAADFHKLSELGIQHKLIERIAALSAEYETLSRTELQPLLESFTQVISKLDASADALLKVLGDENQRHLAAILSNADRGSAQLNEVLARIEDTRARMHHLLEQLDQIVVENRGTLTQGVGDAAAAMQDLRDSVRTVADNVDTIVHYLESGTRNMNEFSREVRENPGILLRGTSPQDPLPASADKR